MPAESSGLIIHSFCGPNGVGSSAEFNILMNPSGLTLGKESGCCCCDVSCLTGCNVIGDPATIVVGDSPCINAPCYVQSSGTATYFPTGIPMPACFDGAYSLSRYNGCAPATTQSVWMFLIGLVWNEGYPDKYRLYRYRDPYEPSYLYPDPSSYSYCLIWNIDHGTNYGIDTCHSTYYDARCCFRYHRWFRLFKVECATQEIVDVTDEAIASFPDEPFGPGDTGWIQISKGYYVKCAYTDASYEDHSGGDNDCTCCGADTKTIDDIYGPPILVCAP